MYAGNNVTSSPTGLYVTIHAVYIGNFAVKLSRNAASLILSTIVMMVLEHNDHRKCIVNVSTAQCTAKQYMLAQSSTC